MKKILIPIIVLAVAMGCNSGNNGKSASETIEDTTAAETEEVPVAKEEKPEKVLRHVVMFKFKETSSEEEIQTVADAFSALPGKIPQIRDYEWGTNNSPEELNKGFTHCFFVTFYSEDDRAAYLPHPDHQAFVEVLKPHMEDVMVLDYWTE